MNVGGVYLGRHVMDFVNSGSITVEAQVGSALGNGSTVTIDGVYAVSFDQGFGTAVNSGDLSVRVRGGAGAEIRDVAGMRISSSIGGSLRNTGRIYVGIDAASASSLDRVAGISVQGSEVAIANPGLIYLASNAPGSDLRTLWLRESRVTLEYSFSIIFGMQGVGPEKKANLRGPGLDPQP